MRLCFAKRRKGSNSEQKTEYKQRQRQSAQKSSSNNTCKTPTVKTRKLKEVGYYYMNGLQETHSTAKSNKGSKTGKKHRKLDNEYFVNWSKVSGKNNVKRQKSLSYFASHIKRKRKSHYETKSSDSSLHGVIKCRLGSKHPSAKFLTEIQRLVSEGKEQAVKQQEEIKRVTGKEAIRLSKLHEIEKAQINNKIQNLRLQVMDLFRQFDSLHRHLFR